MKQHLTGQNLYRFCPIFIPKGGKLYGKGIDCYSRSDSSRNRRDFKRRLNGKEQDMEKINPEKLSRFEKKRISVVRTIAVREKSLWYTGECICCPQDAVHLANPFVENADREYLLVCCLDGKSHPISMEVVSIGIVNQCLVGMREVFKNAILSNAASMIVFHNHPSGACEPSESDLVVSKKLKQAGGLLDIEVLDHIILGEESFCSIAEVLKWKSWTEQNNKIA